MPTATSSPLASYKPEERKKAAEEWKKRAIAEVDRLTREWEGRDAADKDHCAYLRDRLAGAKGGLVTVLRYIKAECPRMPNATV